VITSFGNKLAVALYDDRHTKETRAFPAELRRVARRKLLLLHDAAELRDLRAPPANRLKALKGELKALHSIRINDQWRLVFRWTMAGAQDVAVLDYHD